MVQMQVQQMQMSNIVLEEDNSTTLRNKKVVKEAS